MKEVFNTPVHAPRRQNIWEDTISEDGSLPTLSHLGFTSRGGVIAVGYSQELEDLGVPFGVAHDFIQMSITSDLYYGIIEDDSMPIPEGSRFEASYDAYLSVYDDEGLSVDLRADKFNLYVNKEKDHLYIHAINLWHFPKSN